MTDHPWWSGGTALPTPSPRDNNLFGYFYAENRAPGLEEPLAEHLVQAGWSARKVAADEYVISTEWCSLMLFSDPGGGMTKFAGVIVEERLDDFANALRHLNLNFQGADVRFWMELYDSAGEKVLREVDGSTS